MADIKISQLGAAATISDSDVFPMTANGTTVKAAASLIKEYAIGDDDISALGDGSPTGAILALNANKSAKSDIAMIEASVAIAPHAIGAEFYLSGVLMRATAPIEIGDQIVNGTNCAPADDVSSQIQALTNNKYDKSGGEITGWLTATKIGTGYTNIGVRVTQVNSQTGNNYAEITADQEGGNLRLSKANGTKILELDTNDMNGSNGNARLMLGDSTNGAKKMFLFKENGDFVDGNGNSLDSVAARLNIHTIDYTLPYRNASLCEKGGLVGHVLAITPFMEYREVQCKIGTIETPNDDTKMTVWFPNGDAPADGIKVRVTYYD